MNQVKNLVKRVTKATKGTTKQQAGGLPLRTPTVVTLCSDSDSNKTTVSVLAAAPKRNVEATEPDQESGPKLNHVHPITVT